MKITYLVTVLDGGGAALPIADVVDVMRDQGHEVQVIALMRQDGRACPRLERAGIAYEVIGDGVHRHLKPSLTLLRRLRAQRPDLIWTSLTQATLYGQLAGALLGIPVVSWQHNAYLKPSNRRMLRATRRLTYRWIADSEAVADFSARALQLDPERIDVWPLFFADPHQPAAKGWDGSGPFRIGSLGRLHRNKDYRVIVEAAGILQSQEPDLSRRLQIDLAGAGPQQAELEGLASSVGAKNVRFVGFKEQPFDFLAGLHGYVQPSRNEGLCIAAHEAMHAGLPVLATPVGQLAHSIEDGASGFLRPIGDAPAFAERIAWMVRNPQAAAAMGALAREKVAEHYSRERFVEAGRAALDHASRLAAAFQHRGAHRRAVPS